MIIKEKWLSTKYERVTLTVAIHLELSTMHIISSVLLIWPSGWEQIRLRNNNWLIRHYSKWPTRSRRPFWMIPSDQQKQMRNNLQTKKFRIKFMSDFAVSTVPAGALSARTLMIKIWISRLFEIASDNYIAVKKLSCCCARNLFWYIQNALCNIKTMYHA